MSWRDFYAKVTNPFGAGGEFYHGGHHGADFACDPREAIPAYFEGICVLNAHSEVLGNYTVFRRADGKFAGFAHLLIGTRRDVGDKVKPGDKIGLAAGRSDDHGSAWSGSHCHTTVSSDIHGITNGNVVDPWPSIKAARTADPEKPNVQNPIYTTVRKGEGGIALAERTKVALAALKRLNPTIKDWGALALGQKVRLR